jgi:hypothetical protein
MDFLAWHNVLFLSSTGIGILIAISAALGAADLDDPDFDEGGGSEGPRHGILSFLDLGHIPFTVLLLVSSLTFGITGVAGSLTAAKLLGSDGPWMGVVLVVIAFAVMIFLTGRLARLIIKHVPASETHVASPVDVVGHEGVMFTFSFADVCIGADVHRISCRSESTLAPGARVHVLSYDDDTKTYEVTPLN